MMSLNSTICPEMLHSLVDNFFECKKALVKQRLRDSMEAIVDDLFGELVGQVKEMLLPVKVAQKNTKPCAVELPNLTTSKVRSPPSYRYEKVALESTPKQTGPKSPKSQGQVFAVKSAPGASSQPIGGLKRPREPVIVAKSITSSANVHGSASTPLSDHQASNGDTESIIPEKKFKTEPDNGQDNQQIESIGSDNEALAVINPALGKYLCQTSGCGKRFRKSCTLKDHERTHSGVKPFACKYPGCSHASIKRSNTIDHIRTIHLKNLKPEEGEETPDPKVYLEVKQELLD